MSHEILNINDSNISLVSDGSVSYQDQGFIFVDKKDISIGKEALKKWRIFPKNIINDYWFNLSDDKYKSLDFANYSPAHLISFHLKEIKNSLRSDHSLTVVYPPYMNAKQLSLFLGIANACDISIQAFVQSPVAATRRRYIDSKLVHLDLHLHGMSVSVMQNNQDSSIDESLIIGKCGLIELNKAWAEMISSAFIEKLRFDPLHSAKSDQILYDNLDNWVVCALNNDQVEVKIDFRNQSNAIFIDSPEFHKAVKSNYRLLVNKLRSIFTKDDFPVIQVSDQVARLPGIISILESSFSCKIVILDDLEIEMGATRCIDNDFLSDNPLNKKSLEFDNSPLKVDQNKLQSFHGNKPTHILFGYEIYKISESPIVIGTMPSDENRFIKIESDAPGISREHFSIFIKDDMCIIRDLSRYGTFLNKERIKNETVLQIGDSLSIGSPVKEFILISEGNF